MFRKLPTSRCTVPGGITVHDLLDRHVLRHRHSSYPVVDADGRASGLVTLQEIRLVPPEQRATTLVDDIAVPVDRLARARPGDALLDVLADLPGRPTGRVLVIDDDRVVGIVSASDIIRSLELAQLITRRP